MGGHHGQHIITDAMPIQVAPIVYQVRAPLHKQTVPMANPRSMPLLSQAQQYYDSYAQSKSFGSVLHGTSRMLANPFRLQTNCRPIHSHRFHPYLLARRPECKSYQQVRPPNLIFKLNRQLSSTSRPAPNQSSLSAQPAGPNREPTASDVGPVDMNIDPTDVTNNITVQPLIETVNVNAPSLEMRASGDQCSEETRGSAYATIVDCCPKRPQTGHANQSTLIGPSDRCHERPVTNDQTPESTK